MERGAAECKAQYFVHHLYDVVSRSKEQATGTDHPSSQRDGLASAPTETKFQLKVCVCNANVVYPGLLIIGACPRGSSKEYQLVFSMATIMTFKITCYVQVGSPSQGQMP